MLKPFFGLGVSIGRANTTTVCIPPLFNTSGKADQLTITIEIPGGIGNSLTANVGSYSGTSPITLTYQWKRNGVDIPGETNQVHIIEAADIGNTISVTVTITNDCGLDSATANVEL